jgi:HD-GYP domain-containing protein (c-di-GMP phosphodiesterase class II)
MYSKAGGAKAAGGGKDNSAVAASAAAYKAVKEETESLFDDVAKTERVSREAASSLANAVREQIKTFDASILIQQINGIRKTDEYLHTHSVNVSMLNGLIGKWMRLDDSSQKVLVEIGLLHDVGKLKVPPEILNKPAKLTPEEFKIVQTHPVFAREILERSGVKDERLLRGVLQHHEKGNGHGYPYGLRIRDIDEFARITAISDVYDAMVARRVYKEAHSPFEILAWFAKGCYSDLDIQFVNVFMDAMVEELKGKHVNLSDGTVAEVVYVHPSNFQYPLVRRGDEIIHTSAELSCLTMANTES